MTPLAIMRRVVAAHAGAFLMGGLLLVLTNLFGLAIPRAIGHAIDQLQAGAPQAELERLALLIGALALYVSVVRTGSRLFILGAARRINCELKTEVFDAMLRLDRGYHHREGSGELIARIAHDVRAVRSLCGPALLHGMNVIILYAIALGILISLDAWLTAMALLPLPFLVVAIRLCSRSVLLNSRAAQAALASLTARVQEAIGGLLVLRSYAAEPHEAQRFDAVSEDYRDANLGVARARALMAPLLALGSGLGTLAVIYVGGGRVADGAMTLGELVAFLAYIGQLAWPTFATGWVINIVMRSRPALERVATLLSEEPAVSDALDAAALEATRGDLEIRDLTWRYPGAEQPALRDVDLTLPAGATVALVGRVGSGKSTLLALLARLFPVPDGHVFFDGRDVNAVKVSDLRRAVVQVPQDAFLFSRPIDENIAFGEPEAGGESVRGAARQARIDREIEGFVDGYKTWVGERGVTLSGGQRQRTTMARALLTQPAVLILDDATASLDASTEQEILDELFGLRQGRTTVLVTHRTSAARRCDRIVVLDQGRVEAVGTPAQVLASSPTFRAMAEQEKLRGELAAMRQEDAADRAPAAPDPTSGPGRAAASDAPDKPVSDPTREKASTGALLDRQMLGRLWGLAREHKTLVAITLLLIPIAAAAKLGPPLVIKAAIDDLAVGSRASLALYAGIYLGLIAVVFSTGAVQGYLMQLTGQRVTYLLRQRLFAHVLSLRARFFDRTPVGRVLTRITSDTVALGELFSSGVISIAADALLLVGIVGAMVYLSPALAGWGLALVPLLAAAAWWLHVRLGRAFRAARSRISAVNAYLAEALSGIAVIQLFRQEKRVSGEFDDLARHELEAELDSVRWDSMQSAMVEVSGSLSVAVLIWAGTGLVAGTAATIGVLVATIDYVRLFYTPIRDLAAKYTVLQSAGAGAEKVFALFDVDDVEPRPEQPAALPREQVQGELRFEGVGFAYGDGPPVLGGVDLNIAAGEQIGVVGPTGAGKSTLVKLLCGHYTPTEGRITLDGIPLDRLDPRDLRRAVGLVPQDVYLFGDTVRANLTLGRDDIDDARLTRALDAAEALDLVQALPDGLDTELAERATDLSAGQRQLLAFARVLAHDPPVLVLDEATSAIDHQTEDRIQRALDAVLAGRTAVVVAHRLSTLERVDRIVVVEAGRIIEAGTHAELLARRGVYYRLHRLQFGLAEVG